MNALDEITRSLDDIASAPTLESLDTLRVALLGKNGAITAALKSLGALPPEERKTRGAEVNRAKEQIAEAIAARKLVLEKAEPRPAAGFRTHRRDAAGPSQSSAAVCIRSRARSTA